jgi:hypothetical protein
MDPAVLPRCLTSLESVHSMSVLADKYWVEAAKFVRSCGCAADRVIAPGKFRSLMAGTVAYEQRHLCAAPEGLVLHKGMLEKLGRTWIEQATAGLQPAFANEVFVVFSRLYPCNSVSQSIHFAAYLERLELLSGEQDNAAAIVNQTVDRETIAWACRLFLLREPESENEIDSYLLQCPDVRSLQRAFLASPEFRSLHRAQDTHGQAVAEPDLPRTFFMHFPKTGGTTLHNLLASHYPKTQICPERHNHLINLSIGELSAFRLFSGHFDWSSITLVPARSRRIVTMLRDPAFRLVSMYRFLRAHDPNYARACGLELILLANDCTAEAFFRHSSVRASRWFNNGLVHALTGTIGFGRWERAQDAAGTPQLVGDDPENLLDLAKARLGACTAFGLFEAFGESVRWIARQLGLSPPASVKREMAIEDIAGTHPHIRMVESVELTESVAESMAPLIALDQKLYAFAVEEFSKLPGISEERGAPCR